MQLLAGVHSACPCTFTARRRSSLACRYGETELRERGIEALQGVDRAAAQVGGVLQMQGSCCANAALLLDCIMLLPPPLAPSALPGPLQMLVSACAQGAELDVSLALIKATASPDGLNRYRIFEDVCSDYDLYPCMGCGE